jgi:GNAT superfamily N-acetyltransferase
MNQHYHLAQLNLATMREPLESPSMADFVANIDRINALAECSPGFVWRLKDADGGATSIRPFGENILVNMSVWTDVESLKNYTFKTAHADMLKRKREWFEKMSSAHMVMWWIPAGHEPTLNEASHRLNLLQVHGPTSVAFKFAKTFPPPPSDASTSERASIPASIAVRQATIGDLEQLSVLFDAYRQFYGQKHDIERARNFLRSRFEYRDSIVLVAQEGEHVLGFIQLYPSFSSVATARVFILNDLFVHAAARKRGIATKLLNAATAFARDVGALRLVLSTAKSNATAQALYEKMGWKKDEEYVDYSLTVAKVP